MTRALDHRTAIGLGFLAAVALAMCARPTHGAGAVAATMLIPQLGPTQAALCKAVDGDTLTCLDQRNRRVHIRLSAIDAPELPGHCRKGRVCAPGDPFASKANLAAMIRGRIVRYEILSLDRYGRVVALPRAGRKHLACEQLRLGHAIYWRRYDAFRRLARACPAARPA